MTENNKGLDYDMGVLEWSLCIVLVGIVAVTFAQVLSRYVLQASLAWSEELARYLFMWLASLGAAYAFKTKSHFLLRFVVDKFSVKLQMVVSTLVVALMTIFLVTFIWQAILYTESVAGQIGPGTGLSKAVPVSSAVVGGLLMLFYMVRNWIDEVRIYREHASGYRSHG